MLTDAIRKYFDGKGYNNPYIQRVLKENGYDTTEGIIRNFINNMYVQLIDPSTEELPNELEIGVLSYTNNSTHLKTFYECDLYDMILEELYTFTGCPEYYLHDMIIKNNIKYTFIKRFNNDNWCPRRIDDNLMLYHEHDLNKVKKLLNDKNLLNDNK